VCEQSSSARHAAESCRAAVLDRRHHLNCKGLTGRIGPGACRSMVAGDNPRPRSAARTSRALAGGSACPEPAPQYAQRAQCTLPDRLWWQRRLMTRAWFSLAWPSSYLDHDRHNRCSRQMCPQSCAEGVERDAALLISAHWALAWQGNAQSLSWRVVQVAPVTPGNHHPCGRAAFPPGARAVSRQIRDSINVAGPCGLCPARPGSPCACCRCPDIERDHFASAKARPQ